MCAECSLYPWLFLALGKRRRGTFQGCWVTGKCLSAEALSGRWKDEGPVRWHKRPGRLTYEWWNSAELREGEYWSEREAREFTWKKGASQSFQVKQRSWTHEENFGMKSQEYKNMYECPRLKQEISQIILLRCLFLLEVGLAGPL